MLKIRNGFIAILIILEHPEFVCNCSYHWVLHLPMFSSYSLMSLSFSLTFFSISCNNWTGGDIFIQVLFENVFILLLFLMYKLCWVQYFWFFFVLFSTSVHWTLHTTLLTYKVSPHKSIVRWIEITLCVLFSCTLEDFLFIFHLYEL